MEWFYLLVPFSTYIKTLKKPIPLKHHIHIQRKNHIYINEKIKEKKKSIGLPETQESERSGEAERMPGDGWAAVSVGKELNFGGQILSTPSIRQGPIIHRESSYKKNSYDFLLVKLPL